MKKKYCELQTFDLYYTSTWMEIGRNKKRRQMDTQRIYIQHKIFLTFFRWFCVPFSILAHRFVQHSAFAGTSWSFWIRQQISIKCHQLKVAFYMPISFFLIIVHNLCFFRSWIAVFDCGGAGNSPVYSIPRFDVSSFVARCTDNPIFILTISLNTEHFCYHCDYTHTQISLKAFKCYQNRFIYWITSRVFILFFLYFLNCTYFIRSIVGIFSYFFFLICRWFLFTYIRFFWEPFDRCTSYFYFNFGVLFPVYHW